MCVFGCLGVDVTSCTACCVKVSRINEYGGENCCVIYGLHTSPANTMFVHTSSPVFISLPIHTAKFLHIERHPALFKPSPVPTFHSSYIHLPHTPSTSSFHQSSSYTTHLSSIIIIIHLALQNHIEHKGKNLLPALSVHPDTRSANTFNLSNILPKFSTSIMSSSKTVDKSSDTPDIPTGLPTKPTNTLIIDPIPNPFRNQMPTNMMARKEFSKAGKPASIQINSHIIEAWPKINIAQYDVSLL